MKILWIEEVDSTNNYLKANPGLIEPGTLLLARRQTAGRGQRGNTWESEPEKNLTFSLCLEQLPIHPSEQFAVSEAAALAITDFLRDFDIEARVKWPNDIYVGDKKICGILIEHTIMGSEIARSIIGAGLNINQRSFKSDAPNPVSMTQITGKEYNLEEMASRLGHYLDSITERIDKKEELHKTYLSRLWRGDGMRYPFRDRETGEEFEAAISDVEPNGFLLLDTGRRYAFKEVEFII